MPGANWIKLSFPFTREVYYHWRAVFSTFQWIGPYNRHAVAQSIVRESLFSYAGFNLWRLLLRPWYLVTHLRELAHFNLLRCSLSQFFKHSQVPLAKMLDELAGGVCNVVMACIELALTPAWLVACLSRCIITFSLSTPNYLQAHKERIQNSLNQLEQRTAWPIIINSSLQASYIDSLLIDYYIKQANRSIRAFNLAFACPNNVPMVSAERNEIDKLYKQINDINHQLDRHKSQLAHKPQMPGQLDRLNTPQLFSRSTGYDHRQSGNVQSWPSSAVANHEDQCCQMSEHAYRNVQRSCLP